MGDYSNITYDPSNRFVDLRHLQGRVILDADLNEYSDIHNHRTIIETEDVIGVHGVPKKNDGFKISISSDGRDLDISAGRIYVDGLLCELGKKYPATYSNQVYYPNPDSSYFNPPVITSPLDGSVTSPLTPANIDFSNLVNGTYLVFLDVWQLEINSLDKPSILEIALGGADTTTRIKNIWQVKLLAVSDPAAATTCKTKFPEWDKLTAPTTGKLSVQTKPEIQTDPCHLPPGSGYRGLENQLYRVEIQQGGVLNKSTFKWSRDNGSVETKIEKIEGDILTVSSLGKDDVLGFTGGQWVEIVEEESTFKNSPHPLVQISVVDPSTKQITLKTPVSQYKDKKNLKLRRWDHTDLSATADGIPIDGSLQDLEYGIQVQFSGDLVAGNHWSFAARTEAGVQWPKDESGNAPVAQPPAGIKHHYCKLALMRAANGDVALEDCRDLFPSLTDICAEDICFENDNCQLGQATTVQEALDMLCAANDLRDHNKHLHGYGVVCGLKVVCGADRSKVTIENGYALDCNGNIIRLRKPKAGQGPLVGGVFLNGKNGLDYDVVANAAALLDPGNTGIINGKVSLSIAGNGNDDSIISVEKYVPKSFWEDVLEGSLLKDFFEDAIEPLIDFLTSEFPTSLSVDAPVPLAQRRLTAIINLLAQLINSASGPYGFISGSKERKDDCGEGTAEENSEDQLLWCFYNNVKKLLSSHTFCAMFDKDRQFPAYKIQPGLSTIFGPTLKFHRRLRMHPSGNFAYTCGTDNKIHVYNLGKQEYIQALTFPAATNIQVQDIAINSKGTKLYSVGVLNNKHSIFAMADIAATGLLANPKASVECDMRFVSLGIQAPDNLYAIGLSEGLFEIKDLGLPTFSMTNRFPCNATGMLLIVEGDAVSRAFVASAGFVLGTPTAKYTEVQNIDIIALTPTFTCAIGGTDMGNDMVLHDKVVYITGDVSGARILSGFPILSSAPAFAPVGIPDSSVIRMAASTGEITKNFLFLALSDKFKVIRINLKGVPTPDLKFRIPVQLFPTGIIITAKGTQGYVLNTIVNTLTAINFEKVFAAPTPRFTREPPVELADYRDEVIDAFKDLLSHFLQYLKDAFCERFLVDCPDCTEADKVYLGTVEIRDGKVYHICNFTKRQYVKTFNTYGYWLSTVPILPIIKKSFAKFCCSVMGS